MCFRGLAWTPIRRCIRRRRRGRREQAAPRSTHSRRAGKSVRARPSNLPAPSASAMAVRSGEYARAEVGRRSGAVGLNLVPAAGARTPPSPRPARLAMRRSTRRARGEREQWSRWHLHAPRDSRKSRPGPAHRARARLAGLGQTWCLRLDTTAREADRRCARLLPRLDNGTNAGGGCAAGPASGEHGEGCEIKFLKGR